MFLTLQDFLQHFPQIDISKEEFADTFTIMYSKPQTLNQLLNMVPPTPKRKPIVKSKEDTRYLNREQIIEYFYEIIIRNRYKYLELFYQAYFEFKNPTTLKWSGVDMILKSKVMDAPVISVQKNDASRRMIRNLFYLELLDLTKVTNTVKSRVSFWRSIVNMYNKLELEDRFFAPSSIDLFLRDKGTKREQLSGIKEINHNNLFYLFQAYQPKASIFNPYAIKWTMENIIAKELGRAPETIFTPVLSWACYLSAFMHIPSYKHYVGVDVMPSVCQKTRFLADWYHQQSAQFKDKKVDIICTPSELLLENKEFLSTYSEYFDTVIVCPPYFDMEIYHEGEQSIDNYPDYQTWLKKYWEATVQLVKLVIKSDGVFAVIANDYQTLNGKSYPLTADLDSVTKKYFKFKGMYYLQNRTSPLRAAAKDRTERLFLYKN